MVKKNRFWSKITVFGQNLNKIIYRVSTVPTLLIENKDFKPGNQEILVKISLDYDILIGYFIAMTYIIGLRNSRENKLFLTKINRI